MWCSVAAMRTSRRRRLWAHIDAVVGVPQPMGNAVASRFAEGFYRGLGAGKDVAFAYKLGRNPLESQGIAAAQIPVLTRKLAFDSAQATGEMPLKPKPETQPNDEQQQSKAKRRQPKAERSRSQGVSAGESLAGGAFDSAQATKVTDEETPTKRSRIFISYKRDVAPDETVARAICLALQAQHDVFIDRKMPAGTPWAERIEAELKASDVLIVLLSAHSVKSEMVEHEVELGLSICQRSWPRIWGQRVRRVFCRCGWAIVGRFTIR